MLPVYLVLILLCAVNSPKPFNTVIAVTLKACERDIKPRILKLFQFRRPAGLDKAVMIVLMSAGLGKDTS